MDNKIGTLISKLNQQAAENITDDAKLKEIDAQRVVLMKRLNEEVLKLEKATAK